MTWNLFKMTTIYAAGVEGELRMHATAAIIKSMNIIDTLFCKS